MREPTILLRTSVRGGGACVPYIPCVEGWEKGGGLVVVVCFVVYLRRVPVYGLGVGWAVYISFYGLRE